MNNNYIYDYSNLLERVLSTGYEINYAASALERLISYSSYFQSIENDSNTLPPIISDSALIKSLFPDQNVDLLKIPTYNQCLWSAEAYLRIQEATRLTFEAIFIYLPISKMYDLFPLYHEMDFSQIIDLFKELYQAKSIFAILLEKYHYSLSYVSNQIHVSYETLYSLKHRRRDIKKVSVEIITGLSRLFKVRLETIAEIRI